MGSGRGAVTRLDPIRRPCGRPRATGASKYRPFWRVLLYWLRGFAVRHRNVVAVEYQCCCLAPQNTSDPSKHRGALTDIDGASQHSF